MQKLSQMLSPLKNHKAKGEREKNGQAAQTNATENITEKMNFDTPLSINIPPEPMEVQTFVGYDQQDNSSHQMWSQTYNQQPLLLSKSPEQDKLTQLNMTLGNQYTYQMHDPRNQSSSEKLLANDPRIGYDQCSFTNAQAVPYKDAYYQCAYGVSKTERTAVRHKMDDDNMGPAAKRHCGEQEGSGGRVGGQIETGPQTFGFVDLSNQTDSETDRQRHMN